MDRVGNHGLGGRALPVADRPGQLLGEERVALGLLDHHLRHPPRDTAPAQHSSDHVRALARRQGRQGELGSVGALHPGRPVTGPVGAEQKDRGALQGFGQGVQELLGDRVDPVQVLVHEDDGAVPAGRERPFQKGLGGAGLHRLGCQLGERLGALARSEDVHEERRSLVGVQADLLEPEADLLDQGLGGVGIHDPAVRPDMVLHGEVRDGAAVDEAAPLEPRDRLTAQGPAKLVDESRLADPRLAHDADDLAAAPACLANGLGQRGHLALAPDETAERRRSQALERGSAGAHPDDSVGHHGDAPASRHHLADGLQSHVAGHQPGGRFADQDGPRFGEALEALRHVDGVSDRRELGVHVVTDAPDDDHAGVEAHPSLDGYGQAIERDRSFREAAPQTERGQHRPARMTFPSRRCSHEGHEAVAEELAHPASVAMHLLEGDVVEPVQEHVHRLGAETLGQAGGANDVAEQYGHQLALGLRAGPGRRGRGGAGGSSAGGGSMGAGAGAGGSSSTGSWRRMAPSSAARPGAQARSPGRRRGRVVRPGRPRAPRLGGLRGRARAPGSSEGAREGGDRAPGRRALRSAPARGRGRGRPRRGSPAPPTAAPPGGGRSPARRARTRGRPAVARATWRAQGEEPAAAAAGSPVALARRASSTNRSKRSRSSSSGASSSGSPGGRVTRRPWPGARSLPKPRDIDVHGLHGGGRRLLSPEAVDQPVVENDLVAVKEQQAEQGALLRATEEARVRQRVLEWTKDEDLICRPRPCGG